MILGWSLITIGSIGGVISLLGIVWCFMNKKVKTVGYGKKPLASNDTEGLSESPSQRLESKDIDTYLLEPEDTVLLEDSNETQLLD